MPWRRDQCAFEDQSCEGDLYMRLFMVALWLCFGLCKTGFINLNGKNILGTLPLLLQKPTKHQSAPPLSL
jgi:hypothetical protein